RAAAAVAVDGPCAESSTAATAAVEARAARKVELLAADGECVGRNFGGDVGGRQAGGRRGAGRWRLRRAERTDRLTRENHRVQVEVSRVGKAEDRDAVR